MDTETHYARLEIFIAVTMNPTNYSPISLLPSFLKVFEKALYTRLTKHFNTNKLLVGNQFGFRKGIATEDAIFSSSSNNKNNNNSNSVSIYEAYSEINFRWASVGSPVKVATWHWHSIERQTIASHDAAGHCA
jgi:hypothetical protein